MGQDSSTLQIQKKTDEIIDKLNEEEAFKKKLKGIQEKYRKQYCALVKKAMGEYRTSLDREKTDKLLKRGKLASMPPAVWEQRIGRYLPKISECDEDE